MPSLQESATNSRMKSACETSLIARLCLYIGTALIFIFFSELFFVNIPSPSETDAPSVVNWLAWFDGVAKLPGRQPTIQASRMGQVKEPGPPILWPERWTCRHRSERFRI